MAIIISYPSANTVTTGDNLLGTQFDGESGANITKNFSVGKIVNLVAGIIPAGATGPQGPQGIQGVAGSQGVQGAQGNAGVQGVPGPIGPAGLEWKGAWVSGTSYIADDAVGYSGASWFCILATSGTTAPDLDTTHWALLAAEGLQGPQGLQGLQGTNGSNGIQGIQGVQGIQGIQGIAGPWGSIVGNILSQTDLQNQFAAYVPASRNITINGVTQSLSADRTWTISVGLVNSVFGRTGAVIAANGDYTTTLVTEGTNFYFTNARARTAITLTTTGISGVSTYNNTTGVLNIPQYAAGIPWLESNVTDLTVWNNGKGNNSSNTCFGEQAFKSNTTGGSNTAFGASALSANTEGNSNVSVGGAALLGNTEGSNNTALGVACLPANTTGGQNTGVGAGTLFNSATGSGNTAIGYNSLFSVSGFSNTAIGNEAGRYLSGFSVGNVYLGNFAGPAISTTESDKLYISNSAGTPLIGGNFDTRIVTIDQVLVLTPTTSAPASPVNGMIAVYGVGAAQHIYCYINGAWKQLDN